jgi:hypothetical protein
MIYLYESNLSDKAKIETCYEHWKFNAYVFGPKDNADDDSTRLYRPGDFLIHFAGVYDPWNIYRMMRYVQQQHSNGMPLDTSLLNSWRKSPPPDKESADISLSKILYIYK